MHLAHRFTLWNSLARLSRGLILAVTLIAVSSLAASPRTYVVRKGDTLTSLARTYGLSVAELAESNKLKTTSRLTIGQMLKIPESKTASMPTTATVAKAALPSNVQKAIHTAAVKSGRWRYIIIHHSGEPRGSAAGMNAYHLQVRHMENGLAYHFVIGNGRGMGDGEIAVGKRWSRQLNGGHLASETQNTYSIGVCLVGDFRRDLPTARQLASLKALIEALQHRCNLTSGAVKAHREINTVYTICPGDRFLKDSFPHLRSLLRDDASR
jgi:murein DD-endopeptidase MepM/ murein hydrolase activator NlpD